MPFVYKRLDWSNSYHVILAMNLKHRVQFLKYTLAKTDYYKLKHLLVSNKIGCQTYSKYIQHHSLNSNQSTEYLFIYL